MYGLERCGGNATSVLGRWGKGEVEGWNEGSNQQGGTRGQERKQRADGEQQWSNSGRAAVCQGMAGARWVSSMSLNTDSLRHGTASGKVREHGHTCHNKARRDKT